MKITKKKEKKNEKKKMKITKKRKKKWKEKNEKKIINNFSIFMVHVIVQNKWSFRSYFAESNEFWNF